MHSIEEQEKFEKVIEAFEYARDLRDQIRSNDLRDQIRSNEEEG
jgi:hypothetical protein